MNINQEQKNNCYLYECNQKGCSNIGASNRIKYDTCEYQKSLYESTKPLSFQMFEGKYNNCGRCVHDKIYRPFDLVDIESELKNITRPASKCAQFKYNPNCKQSSNCTSTYDRAVPIVLAPQICPIVRNNIPKMTHPGYTMPRDNICARPGSEGEL